MYHKHKEINVLQEWASIFSMAGKIREKMEENYRLPQKRP